MRHFNHLIVLVIFSLLSACNRQVNVVPPVATVSATHAAKEPTIVPSVTMTKVSTAAPAAVAVKTPVALPAPNPVHYTATWLHVSDSATEPIMVEFDKNMDVDSAESPLKFSPPVKGTFEWNADHTQLTFTPTNPFAQDNPIYFQVDWALTADDGSTFGNNPVWRLFSGPLFSNTVKTSDPNVVDLTPEFILDFERHVNRQLVEQVLSVDPAIAFEMTWVGDELTISIIEPIATGTILTLLIDGTVGVDDSGEPLIIDWIWTYSVPPLIVDTVLTDFRKGVFDITFNYAPDQETALGRVHLFEKTGAGEGYDELSFTGAWRNDKVLSITSQKPMSVATIYAIKVEGEVLLPGVGTIPADYTVLLQSPSAIMSVSPSQEMPAVDLTKPITVEFYEEMDHASAEAAFSISPEIVGTFSWQGTTMLFTPSLGHFPFAESYIATISEEARTAKGEPIMAESDVYVWSFNTEWGHFDRQEVGNSFGFGADIQLVKASGRRTIHQNIGRDFPVITYTLYAVSPFDFIELHPPSIYAFSSKIFQIDTSKLKLIEQWSSDELLQNTTKLNAEIALPQTAKKGFYLLEMGTADWVYSRLFVNVTDYVVVAKKGGDTITAWVTDMWGRSAAGAVVQVLGTDKTVIATAVTDENGVARLKTPAWLAEPSLVTATVNGELTMTGLDGLWDLPTDWLSHKNHLLLFLQPRPRRTTSTAIYTDRPIYHLGQTVSFRAVIRNDENDQITLPPYQSPITVEIFDQNDELFETQTLATNRFGTINSYFELPESAPSGNWRLIVHYRNNKQPYRFTVVNRISAPTAPEFEVKLISAKPFYIADEPGQVTLEVRTMTGEPLANSKIKVAMNNVGWRTVMLLADVENDYFIPNAIEYLSTAEWQTVTTDENGSASVIFEPYVPPNSTYGKTSQLAYRDVVVRAGSLDNGAPFESNMLRLRAYDTTYAIELQTEGQNFIKGEAVHFKTTVTTPDGSLAAGRLFKIQVERQDENGHSYTITFISSFTSGDNGEYAGQITLDEAGLYRLTAIIEDDAGHKAAHYNEIKVHGDAFERQQVQIPYLDLRVSEGGYRPGETAELMILSDVSGPAWLTVERDSVLQQAVVELTAPLTIVPIEISAESIPNIYVTLSVWRPYHVKLNGDSDIAAGEARLHTTHLEIPVSIESKLLNIEIVPDEEVYDAGEEMGVTLRVTDNEGKGVSAELSLAVVEDALLTLRLDNSILLADLFYDPHDHNVQLYHSMAPIRDLNPNHSGSGYQEDERSNVLNLDFSDTTIWYPALVTNRDGELHLTITLPANPAAWRLTAKAVTVDTKVGQASIVVHTIAP